LTDTDARSYLLAELRPTGSDTDPGATRARTTTALTVVLPCFNEAERLPATLTAFLAALSPTLVEVEVLVVDDGSSDETFAVASAVAATDARVRVIGSRPNRGKGFAVRAGVLAAQGEVIVFTDADGSYGPDDLERVVAALADAPVAIGSRAAWLASRRRGDRPACPQTGQQAVQPHDPGPAATAVP